MADSSDGTQPNWEFGGDSLILLPYAQRQRIAVVDDEIAYAERVARETAAALRKPPTGRPSSPRWRSRSCPADPW